jgi:hypothetical protein
MIKSTVGMCLAAALIAAVVALPFTTEADASPFNKRDIQKGSQPRGELRMIRLQQTVSQRQQAVSLSGRLLQSTTCKQCINNIR